MFNPSKVKPALCATKVAYYFSFPLLIPVWTKYLATDRDGVVYAFSSKPVINSDVFLPSDSVSIYLIVGRAAFDGDWRDSLVELPNG